MSVQTELEAAANLRKSRGESDDDYKLRVVEAINDVDDATWAGLSSEAQVWFNKATDCLNDKVPLPAYPEEEPAAAPARSRRAAQEPAAEEAPATVTIGVDDEVRVVNHRDKEVEGVVVEIGDDFIVIKDANGKEHEFERERLKSFEVLKSAHAEEAAGAGGGDGEPQVGDIVTIKTNRGTEFTGELTQIDDTELAIMVDGEELFYQRKRLDSITLVEEGSGGAAEAGGEAKAEVGDTVKAINKRGREIEGEVVAIEDDGAILIVNDNGKEVELDVDTAQELEIIKASKPAASARSTRNTKAQEPAAAAPARGSRRAAAAPAEAGKSGKVTLADNNGVSVTIRMREIICENPNVTLKDVAAQLKKEKLEYKDNTLGMIFKDTQKVIEFLKKYGHLKK